MKIRVPRNRGIFHCETLQQPDQSHAAFTAILQSHVKDAVVNYRGLKKNPAALAAYLETLASVSGPPSTSSQADKIGAQLDAQGRSFLGDRTKNHLDAKNKTLCLSPIFQWFKGDFTTNAGSGEKFGTPYFNEPDRQVILRGGLSVKYTDYNGKLNQQ